MPLLASKKQGEYDMRNGQWTYDELALLLMLNGLTLDEAKQLIPGRSRDSIKCKGHALGINFTRVYKGGWSEEHVAILRELAPQRIPSSEIAKRVGRNITAVQSKACHLGIKIRGKRKSEMHWTDERLAYALRRWDEGATGLQIADEIGDGFTRSAVLARVMRAGRKRGTLPADMMRQAHAANRKRAKPKQPKRPPPVRQVAPKAGDGFTLLDIKEHRRRATEAKRTHTPYVPEPQADDRATVTHNDLARNHCRWVVGDPGATYPSDPLFCGAKRERVGRPYCQEHNQRAYRWVPIACLQVYGE